MTPLPRESSEWPEIAGVTIKAMVADSVWERVTVTIWDGWLRLDFDADDLDSIQFKLSDLGPSGQENHDG